MLLLCNLVEYSNDYAKTSVRLCRYLKNDPNDDIINSELFKYKSRFASDNNEADCECKNVVPLKYLSNFWRTLEVLLISHKINLMLTWLTN